MYYQVMHRTAYAYSFAVFLEPHVIRLRPRCDGTQTLMSFDLRVKPTPSGLTECSDLEGNATAQVWFEGPTDTLEIVTAFEVETLRPNPFDYVLLEVPVQTLPMIYARELEAPLSLYRSTSALHETVDQFARAVAKEVDGRTVPFLTQLSRRIYDTCKCVIREEGEAQLSEVTLAAREGSCRDLAVLFISACRVQGIAARFVSGYQEGVADQEKRELHAWAEVYLPGGGWRGYDPTHGLAVAERHIVLAVGLTPLLAAPITGSFRGTGAMAKMAADIELKLKEKNGSKGRRRRS